MRLGYIAFNMATSKSYKDVSEVKASLKWQEKRSEVREKSTKGKYLRSSLQCLSNDDVLLLFESILQRSKDGTLRNYTVKGLRAVSPHVRESRRVLDSGFHTVDSGFRVLDSGFQLSGFRIPKRAGFQIFLCVF